MKKITGAQANKLPVGSVVTTVDEYAVITRTDRGWVWVEIQTNDPWIQHGHFGALSEWTLLHIGRALMPKVGDVINDASALDLLPLGSVTKDVEGDQASVHVLNICVEVGRWEHSYSCISSAEALEGGPVRVIYIPED